MAYIDWYAQRSTWRIRYSITLGRIKEERSRHNKSTNEGGNEGHSGQSFENFAYQALVDEYDKAERYLPV